MTHTYAKLEITPASFNEIYEKLLKAGYECLSLDGTLDLSGINLARKACETSDPIFTKRQIQILSGVALGQTNKQIAFDHGISEKTVKAHLTALFQILKVANRTQALIAYQRWMSSPHASEPVLSSPSETISQAPA